MSLATALRYGRVISSRLKQLQVGQWLAALAAGGWSATGAGGWSSAIAQGTEKRWSCSVHVVMALTSFRVPSRMKGLTAPSQGQRSSDSRTVVPGGRGRRTSPAWINAGPAGVGFSMLVPKVGFLGRP
jgi:hypothetical protein